jgi:hypothetical protein
VGLGIDQFNNSRRKKKVTYDDNIDLIKDDGVILSDDKVE